MYRKARVPSRNPLLGKKTTRSALVCVVVGALVAALLIHVYVPFTEPVDLLDSAAAHGGKPVIEKSDFTKSGPGDCFDWPTGQPTKLRIVSCSQPHYYEVAGGIDPSVDPTHLGPSAPYPTREFLSKLEAQMCPAIIEKYLGHPLDPQGKYVRGLLYADQQSWAAGDRTIRCGVHSEAPNGEAIRTSGDIKTTDESMVYPVGTCVGISQGRPTSPIACSRPHAFEVVGIVDLTAKFGGPGSPFPSENAQTTYLGVQCPRLAETYVGGAEALRLTTLQPIWGSEPQTSWDADSRKVMCYLASTDSNNRFATLVGSAKDRATLTIDGSKPNPPPKAPPGRRLPTPVPLPPGVAPNPVELPAGG